MILKAVVSFSLLSFAFLILLISVFRSASVKYEFSEATVKPQVEIKKESVEKIEYYLPYPGRVLPDSSLWFLKAFRDKIWLSFTTNTSRRAELKLLFADKRLAMSKILFEKGNPELGYSTLSKGEKYLEEASKEELFNRKKGIETLPFIQRLTLSSLKHVEVINEILLIAPEDAKPKLVEVKEYALKVYEDSRNALNEKGVKPSENPFTR